MKNFIGNVIISIGLILGTYLGFYILLYGGIVQIINSINPVNASGIAIGIIKVLFSGTGFYVGFIPAYYLGLCVKE